MTPPKNCSPVSTTPPINFWVMSTTPAIRQSCLYQLPYTWKWKIRKNFIFRCNVHTTKTLTKNEKNYTWNVFSFIAGVVDTAEQHPLPIISANFRKKSKRSQRHTQGPGITLIFEKTWSRKSRVRLPLRTMRLIIEALRVPLEVLRLLQRPVVNLLMPYEYL